MNAFIYNGDIYIRTIPCKKLFNSTMVHEVVNRGDIFAVRCSDQQLTVIPGIACVEHIKLHIPQLDAVPAPVGVLSLREELKKKIDAEVLRMQKQGKLL